MTEIEEIIDDLERNHDGDPWHGPSLKENLAGVSAQQALVRPIEGAHNIWEIVSHIAAWENVVHRRLDGHVTAAPKEGDFPSTPDASEESWAKTLAHLDHSHGKLLEAVGRVTDARLSEIVVGTNYSIRFMLCGAARHSVYHCGQVGLLRKASASH